MANLGRQESEGKAETDNESTQGLSSEADSVACSCRHFQ
jgi:hypothetical protein